MKKPLSLILTAIMLLALLTGCGAGRRSEDIRSIDQLNHEKYSVGYGMGTAAKNDVAAGLPKATGVDFTTDDDGYLAMKLGTIDAFATTNVQAQISLSRGLSGVRLLDGELGEGADIVVGISRQTAIPDLTEKINSFIDAVKADGTYDRAYRYWILENGGEMPNIPAPEHPVGVIHFGTCGQVPSYSYYRDGELVGLDVEMMYRFAAYMNMEADISDLYFTALISAAEAGTVDCIFADLYATPERAEVMDFSKPMERISTVLLVRDDSASFSLSDYDGKRIGFLTGSIFGDIAAARFPNAELCYCNTLGDSIAALSNHTIDGLCYPIEGTDEIIAGNPGFVLLNEPVGYSDYAAAFDRNENGQALCREFNAYLKTQADSGELDAIYQRWSSGQATEPVDLHDLSDGSRILRLATCSECFPFAYVLNGGLGGCEIELVAGFCREMGYALQIDDVPFSSIIQGLAAGLYDCAACGITVTPERAESVLFSDVTYQGKICLLVNTGSEASRASFTDTVRQSFEKTFIRESRWKLIVRGIGATVYISLFSVLIGTVLGFLMCMVRCRHERVSFAVTTVYIRILQGTPIVVLLMLLYYLVLAKVGMSGEWVAIIGFSLSLTANASEIMRSGIEAVDPGQTEAALALGFTPRRAFFKFVFPQAARSFLPVYRGELIMLVKSTSIVGYISVQDLTKMSDIIRSSTYEAFFPLISTAILYFILCRILGRLLIAVEKKLEPDRKNRAVKGVVEQ